VPRAGRAPDRRRSGSRRSSRSRPRTVGSCTTPGTERIVQTNGALRASYLQRLDAIQGALVDAARDRARAAGHAWDDADPAPAAAVGAAFACMRTANELAASTGRDLSELLDETFGRLAAIVSAPTGPRT